MLGEERQKLLDEYATGVSDVLRKNEFQVRWISEQLFGRNRGQSFSGGEARTSPSGQVVLEAEVVNGLSLKHGKKAKKRRLRNGFSTEAAIP